MTGIRTAGGSFETRAHVLGNAKPAENVVVCAVLVEPVSCIKFPDRARNTGKFSNLQGIMQMQAQIIRLISES